MYISQIFSLPQKQRLMPLLLEADPDVRMAQAYLPKADVHVLWENGAAACVCAVARLGPGLWEIKNLACAPGLRGRGLGSALLAAVCAQYTGSMRVGTGNSSTANIRFYTRRGFRPAGADRGFFLRNYPAPIFEDGVRCEDLLFFEKSL